MSMKYWVQTSDGVYLGGWEDGHPDAPTGETEVTNAPANAADIWNGSSWDLLLPTHAEIDLEAYRRIADSGHDWMAARETGGGIAMPANIKTYAADIRVDADNLQTTPVADYTNDTHWTDAP